MNQSEFYRKNKTPLMPVFQRGAALKWKRVKNTLDTNVKWVVISHSPDGFEIGYAGSGPADLALNVMAELFPVLAVPDDVQLRTKCYDGQVSNTAWRLHQAFKFKFLVNVDRNEGQIEWSAIDEWLRIDSIQEKIKDEESRTNSP